MARKIILMSIVLLFAIGAQSMPRTGARAEQPAALAQGFSAQSAIETVTLPDTSIDGPGFWTSPAGSVRSVIAWAGTDSAHHLNVMTSPIGDAYGNKRTLSETSATRPAVTRASNGAIIVAWTGLDGNRSLNILYDVYGVNRKVTLWHESSFTAPSLAIANGVLWLAWTGRDANQTLNVIPVTLPDLSAGAKTVLPAQYNSVAAPQLSFDPLRNALLLCWSARTPANTISFASSSNGASWSERVVLPQTTASSPSMIGVPASAAAYMPGHYLAWTNPATYGPVMLQYTESYPSWPVSAATQIAIGEYAYHNVVAGFVGGPKTFLIAWTGIDAAHHLNVAIVTPSSTCSPLPGVTPVSSAVIYHGNTSRKQVAITFDSDNGSAGNALQYLAILRQHNLRVTWFLTGLFVQANPSITKQIRADGHDIGFHTVDHPDLANPPRSNNYVCYELTYNNQLVADTLQVSFTTQLATPPVFRPPYGAFTSQTSALAGAVGYRTVMWNIDPRDWDPATTTQDIVNRVLNSSNLGNGAIILMHVNSAHETEALPRVIAGLEQQGYQIVTLSELVR